MSAPHSLACCDPRHDDVAERTTAVRSLDVSFEIHALPPCCRPPGNRPGLLGSGQSAVVNALSRCSRHACAALRARLRRPPRKSARGIERVRLASRMDRIGTETAFEAAARARALEATGRDVIHLEIGEPGLRHAAQRLEARRSRAPRRGPTHYTAATGIAPLREAIAADVQALEGHRRVPRPGRRHAGAKPIMFFAMLALIEDGRRGHLPEPGFPIYESMARYVGGTPWRRHCARRTTSGWTSTRSPRSSRRAPSCL